MWSPAIVGMSRPQTRPTTEGARPHSVLQRALSSGPEVQAVPPVVQREWDHAAMGQVRGWATRGRAHPTQPFSWTPLGGLRGDGGPLTGSPGMAQGPAGATGLWRAEAHRWHGLGPGETHCTACSEAQPSQSEAWRAQARAATHRIPAVRPRHLLLPGETPGLRLLSPGWPLGRQEWGAGSGGPVPPSSGGTAAPSPALPVRWKAGEGSETPVAQGALPSAAKPVPARQASVLSPGESAQTPRAVCPPGAHHLSWAQSLSLLPGTRPA